MRILYYGFYVKIIFVIGNQNDEDSTYDNGWRNRYKNMVDLEKMGEKRNFKYATDDRKRFHT